MTKKPSAKSEACERLALHLRAEKIGFLREYKFHETRKWRLDFMVRSDYQGGIAVEVDGGNHMVKASPTTGRYVAVGRHTKSADYTKLNAAEMLGWHVLRFTPEMVKSGEAIKTIKEALD